MSLATNSAAPARAFAALDDEALYARFVKTRDADAFDEMARRFQGFAFRVAYCVCAQAELAEEAAQEAFVQLAREDAGFRSRGAGSFRAWFYRLVAHVAHTHSRAERRSARRVKSRRFLDEAHSIAQARAETAAGPVLAPAADGEALASVRAAIGLLAEELRAPIVMHYIDGLSQADVARCVGVSGAQISRRIARGLDLLRRRVAESGAAFSLAALPSLLQHEALLPVPPALGAKLARLNLNALAAEGARQSLRVAAAKGAGSLVLPAVLAASLAVAGGAWWWATQAKATQAPPRAAAAQEKAEAPAPEPAPVAQDYSAEWSFEQGIPDGFRMVEGKPEWRPAHEAMPAGCRMPSRMDVDNVFLLPVEAPERGPFVVRITGFFDEYTDWSVGVGWAEETRFVSPKSSWKLETPLRYNQIYTFEYYFYGRFVVARLFEAGAAGSPPVAFNALAYERWRPAERLSVSADNWVVRSISLAPVAEADIPADVRALEAVVVARNQHGYVRKPEFAGPDGPDTALADGFKRTVSYRRAWTFENGLPEDMKTELAPCQVVPADRKKVARLVAAGSRSTMLFFPSEVPAAPLKLRLRVVMNPPDPKFEAVWAHDNVSITTYSWSRNLDTTPGKRYEYTVYLVGSYAFEFRGAEFYQISQFDRPWPARRLVMGFRDLEIEALEIEALQTLDDLPEIARNPEEAKAFFAQKPSLRGIYRITDSAAKTLDPGK